MKKKKRQVKKMTIAEAICPSCGKEVPGYRCRFCGATKNISSVSGNIIWMKNGRIVAAFSDEKQAYVRMAKQYGISEADWPEKFRKEETK